MEFERLLELVSDEPVFETSLLLAGNVKPPGVRLQLARWAKSGKVYQLRRGLYALAPPYQKVKPHPFLVANRMQRASYVSGSSALAFFGLIPDTLYATFSVTTRRPEYHSTPLGNFAFQHIKPLYLRGYLVHELGCGQHAFIATPEKALLDLVYLQPAGDTLTYLQELRLQNLERLDLIALQQQAEIFGSPKMLRAFEVIRKLVKTEAQEYEML
ncbi:MAG: hypothetical protein JW841_09225 [Deltaproteobacteria bacterium]|nr:hypothetical protein [Deltaproteobacteria bacterium]